MNSGDRFRISEKEKEELKNKIQKEKESFERKHILSGLMNTLPELIFYKSKDGVFLGCNKAFEEYFNITEKELIGKTDFDLFPKEQAVRLRKIEQDLIENLQPQVYEENVKHPNGTVHLMEVYRLPFVDSHNELVGILGVERNITERKAMENALKKSEKQFRQLIETMNEGVAILNKQGLMTYVNSKLCDMLGYSKEEMLNRPTFDFIDSNKPLSHRYQTAAQEDTVKYYEMEWLKKDGSTLITLVSPSDIYDKNELTGRLVILTDITLLKKTEYQLSLKNIQLHRSNKKIKETLDNLKAAQAQLIDAEKMASLGQLTAGIAHEINNPINFVSGNINPLKLDLDDMKELIRKFRNMCHVGPSKDNIKELQDYIEELDLDYLFEEIDQLLGGIEEGAKRTRDIVAGLRNFSRLDEDDFKQADIHEGLDSTLILLKNKLKNRITVQKQYDKIPKIECLPGKLNQVFMNILNNAAQAIEDQGEIIIKTLLKDDKIIISIKDNGPGIPEETKKHIFEPFFTTKDVGAGTGLGLSISKGIIDKHEGTIEVYSEPGQGTEFIITLPKFQKV